MAARLARHPGAGASRRPKPGGDQQGAEFVAVQPGRVGLVVEAGRSDMSGRGAIEEFFFDGVPVEPGDGAQAARDSGPGTAASFQVTGEAFDVGTARLEQSQMVLLAPVPAP
jgi:hypothetical protein